jgi:hypothetical protein
MTQLLLHLIGDYILQPHWIAVNKTKEIYPAAIHGIIYTIPFVILTQNIYCLLIIGSWHIIIDRYRLANYISKIKNWNFKTENGYPENTPIWLSVWLMIITDNTIHLIINFLALKYFI